MKLKPSTYANPNVIVDDQKSKAKISCSGMEILGTLVKLQISAGKWIINPQSMVVHRFLNSPQIMVKQC
jgi:hypothetical protein